MPTVLISTLTAEGKTSVGSYSLCFPYYIAGKDCYAMLLECRNSSNTAQNLLSRGHCALNFIEDSTADFKEAIKLGFPGETSEEKMANCKFELEMGQCEGERPHVIKKAFQVFECTWQSNLENAFEDSTRVGLLDGIDPPYRDFNGITSRFGCHFILKIDKILMKEKYYQAIISGAKASPFPKSRLITATVIQQNSGSQNFADRWESGFPPEKKRIFSQSCMRLTAWMTKSNLPKTHAK